MKNALIGLIVVAVLAVGGYAIFHKPSKMTPSTAPKTSTQSNAPAVNNAVLITKTASGIGQYLAEPDGTPLYTYNADSSGVSNCTGSCLAAWPAYQDKGSTTGLPAGVGTLKRTDNGEVQYTYNGMPLYTFVSDSNGQVTGDGVQNFKVARPAAATSTQPMSTPSSTTPSSNNSSAGNPY